MTGAERRHQLIDIARSLFAERGYDGTSIEEIAQRANVSKPVVYEHFGGKEGLYAVVVDREMSALLDGITSSLTDQQPVPAAHRAGRAGAADLRRRTHRRLPHPDPRLTGGDHLGHLLDAAQRRRQPGVVDPGRRLLPPRPRPRHGAAVRPGAGRLGVDDRAVVARRPRAEEGSGGRAPGQPVLERADAPRERPACCSTSERRSRPCRIRQTACRGSIRRVPRMEAS